MKHLTLEELQKMNGQPVFVITKDGKKFWALVNMNSVYADNTRVFFFDSPYSCKKYGEIWLAYAYHPTHIEREQEADEDANRIIKLIKDLLRICDFELIERIQIRHKPTGREYR